MILFDDIVTFQDRPIDVLSVGELLVDLISTGYDDVSEEVAYRRYFGGSPANIAMNLRRLGVHSQVSAAIGRDRLGEFLLDRLSKAGLEPDYVEAVDHATSMVLLNKSQSSPVPIFYRNADYHLPYSAGLQEALMMSKVIHFSCWPISMQPARGTIEGMIETAAKHKVWIGFDPNYHPMLWAKGEDGVAYVKSLIGQVDVVKPSNDDAERLFGKDTPENQIQKFIDLGAKLVIYTMGQDGALVSNGQETLNIPTMATEVVDTTGAGDAFWSGFYAALVQGYPMRESIHLGFAVSAYKLRYTGAVVELPQLETIKNLYRL